MKPLVSNPETKQKEEEKGRKVDKLKEIKMAKWDFYRWPPVSAGEISCRADITLIAGTRERRSKEIPLLSVRTSYGDDSRPAKCL